MLEDNKAWSWEENVSACAARLSQKIEEAFVFEMKKGEAFLPYKHATDKVSQDEINEQRIIQMEIFVDYTIGTAMAILTQYASLQPEFEQHVIDIVKDKFERLRTIRKLREAPVGVN